MEKPLINSDLGCHIQNLKRAQSGKNMLVVARQRERESHSKKHAYYASTHCKIVLNLIYIVLIDTIYKYQKRLLDVTTSHIDNRDRKPYVPVECGTHGRKPSHLVLKNKLARQCKTSYFLMENLLISAVVALR